MGYLSLRPSEICYSQDSINNVFDKNSSHCYRRIGETLDDLCEGRCSVYAIPTITVVEKNNKWFTCDNRRLWVFRQLERLGKCQDIKVQKGFYIPAQKFTTYNEGVSVSVRRNPGGQWYSRPSQVKIDRQQSVRPSTGHVIEERTQATIPSFSFSNSFKNEARDTTMSSYHSNPTPEPSKTRSYASDDVAHLFQTRTPSTPYMESDAFPSYLSHQKDILSARFRISVEDDDILTPEASATRKYASVGYSTKQDETVKERFGSTSNHSNHEQRVPRKVTLEDEDTSTSNESTQQTEDTSDGGDSTSAPGFRHQRLEASHSIRTDDVVLNVPDVIQRDRRSSGKCPCVIL